MEVNTIFKIVGAVVLGLIGFFAFGVLSAIVGAVIGGYFGPIAIKKFLDTR